MHWFAFQFIRLPALPARIRFYKAGLLLYLSSLRSSASAGAAMDIIELTQSLLADIRTVIQPFEDAKIR
jgi:hypothetical protein